jgi:hypothetical protein
VDARTGFAYDELLLGALVIAVSKKPPDRWLRMAVRLLLSRVEQWVHEHIEARRGTIGMTCSETVAVSFDEAAPPIYAIEVDLDRDRDYQIFGLAPQPERPNIFSPYDALKKRYAELVAAAVPSIALGLHAAVGAAGGAAAGTDLPPGTLTPRDLQTSPSLTKIGRLSERTPPPATASWSTFRLFLAVIREYLLPAKTIGRS